MIKWEKASEYAIKSNNGRFYICKNYLDGCTLYVLYDGDKIIGHWEDACEAKSMAETLSNA